MNPNQLKYAEIFSFLAFIFLISFIFISNLQEKKSRADNITSKENQRKFGQLERENERLKKEIHKFQVKKNDLAPIILDEKVVAYHFESGKANLKEGLKQYIEKTLITDIENKFRNNRGAIDTIEVIGHTDGEPIKPIKGLYSNLDEKINKVAVDGVDIKKLRAGSNADLGLMRAIAVVKELKRIKKEGKGLKILDELELQENKVFRAYSAGQLTDINGIFSKHNPSENKKRRRIEIRFTKLNYRKIEPQEK